MELSWNFISYFLWEVTLIILIISQSTRLHKVYSWTHFLVLVTFQLLLSQTTGISNLIFCDQNISHEI